MNSLNRLNINKLAAGSTLRSSRLRLIAPAYLDTSRVTFSRSQSSSFSTALASDGLLHSEFAANVPRYFGTARRLLIAGQRTNLAVNARTPFSTGWTNFRISGVATTTGPDGGASSAYSLNEGTDSGSHSTASANISFTSGVSYVASAFVRPGTCTTCQLILSSAAFGADVWSNFDLSGSGALGTGGASVTRRTIQKYGDWFRIEVAGVATSTSAGAIAINLTTSTSAARGQSYTGTSRTFSAAWVQVEAAEFASTTILPPSGSPAAATRGADIVTASLTVPCTVLFRGSLGQNATSAADQVVIQLDGGSDNDRYRLRNVAGGATIVAGVVSGGVSSDATSAGSMTASTLFSAGISVDAAGRIASCLDGNTVQAATGGPTSITTLRIGSNASGASNLFGEAGYVDIIRRVALTDAQLQAAVASYGTS